MITIRPLEDADWPSAWRIMQPVFRAGETYALRPDITEADARHLWVDVPAATFAAADESGAIVGTYFLKPNHSGPGSHVANCGYIVAEAARGRGIASAMCEHSQREARSRGFRAMQFNFVVATNEGAVRLWTAHGFEIVGRLPEAFHHPRFGFVDAFVMYKRLQS